MVSSRRTSIFLVPCRYSVWLSHAFRACILLTLLPLLFAGTACADDYTISGKVTLSDGTPMDGIQVSATTDTGSDTFYTYTAADGTDLYPGT